MLKMEDVPGKKVLDFSGRMVHNEVYPSGGAKSKGNLLHIAQGEPENNRRKNRPRPGHESLHWRIEWRAAYTKSKNARIG